MTIIRQCDRINKENACEPLLIENENVRSHNGNEISKGIIRRQRIEDDPTLWFRLIRKRQFIIFTILCVIIIYRYSTVITLEAVYKIPVLNRSSQQENITKHLTQVENVNATQSTLIDINVTTNFTTETSNSLLNTTKPGYLVWSDKCRIPNLNPFASDVMKYFKRENYETCSKTHPLTSIKFSLTTNQYILTINDDVRKEFVKNKENLECSYRIIRRCGSGKDADKKYTLSKRVDFVKSIALNSTIENILVNCSSNSKETYKNAHALIPERPEIRERLNEWKTIETERALSVLMIGVDSISRQNLIRSMPKTVRYLHEMKWFEMNGYNKIDDNTFPNFMGLFAGYDSDTAYHKCKPTSVGGLDKCPLVWYDFQKYGYVTAYAEDEQKLSTFNYLKRGFEKPPTDYYMRPFLLAAENYLPIKRKSGLNFCLGYQHSADYIYDYALEFATTYSKDPYFGLFWTNTFSHNAISDPSSMDFKMVEYMKKFEQRGILNQSAVIFFSDHGIRFGPTRKLLSGRYEERLPFFFIWLPSWFQNKYPEYVNALKINKNRLTNPYDVHMTLKHFIELSGRTENLPKALNCPNCQTLLNPVPYNRSCEEIAIGDHWCTCFPYKRANKNSELIQKAVHFSIDYINEFVSTFNNGSYANKCSKLYFNSILHPNKRINLNNKTLESYEFVFETKPGGGQFEVTINYNTKNKVFQISDSISRLNSYAKDSSCVSEAVLKKYCFCKS